MERATHIWEVIDAKPFPLAEATRGPRGWRYRPLLSLSSRLSAPRRRSFALPLCRATVPGSSPSYYYHRRRGRSPVGIIPVTSVTPGAIAVTITSRTRTFAARCFTVTAATAPAAGCRAPTTAAASSSAAGTAQVKDAATARPTSAPAPGDVEDAAAAGRIADHAAHAPVAAATAATGEVGWGARGKLSGQRW